jgi:hypothetical protein
MGTCGAPNMLRQLRPVNTAAFAALGEFGYSPNQRVRVGKS